MKGILAGQCLPRTCDSACHCPVLIHCNNRFHYQTRKRNKHSLTQFLLQELLHLSFPLSPQPLPRPQETRRTEELLSWAQLPLVTSAAAASHWGWAGAEFQHFPEAPAAFHITAGTELEQWAEFKKSSSLCQINTSTQNYLLNPQPGLPCKPHTEYNTETRRV